MPTNRTVCWYHFKLGNRCVCTGITYDIDWRGAERQDELGWGKGHIVQVSDHATAEVAIAVERGLMEVREPAARYRMLFEGTWREEVGGWFLVNVNSGWCWIQEQL